MPQISDDQLDSYLEGVDPDIANEIRARYADAVAYQNAGTWTREQTFDWLNEQLGTMTAGDKEPGGTGTSSVRMAIEASAQRAGEAAQQAASSADERSARVRASTRAANEYVYDTGPSLNPGQISTSLAIGAWVDDNGNYIDPATGQIVDTPVPADANAVFEQIRGQRFNMGTLTMPGYKERRTKNYIPARGFTGTEPGTTGWAPGADRVLNAFGIPTPPALQRPRDTRVLTPSQAMALLNSMDEAYLLKLQQGMWDAGLYGAAGDGIRPDWGKADPGTQAAFKQLFIEASLDPHKPLNQVLADLAQRNIANLKDVPGAPGSSTGQAPAFRPEVASEATLSKMIDELGQNLLGEYVDPDTKKSLIAKLQGSETETQRKQYEQDLSLYNAGSASGVPGMEDIDAFMAAIGGLESAGSGGYNAENAGTGAHGKYQIMPDNWRPWATRAGLGPDAPQTPQNQEIVAKRIMMDYYAQFGNWRDVAIAWFAGPRAVGAPGSGSRSDGNMTVNEYADSILNKMAQIKGSGGGPAGAGAGAGQMFDPIERFDPAAEAEAALKAADPVGWFGHQWGERATEFYNLLGGVV